jgi:hypothetical protein
MATSETFSISLNKAQLAEVTVAMTGIANAASRVLSRAINKTLDGVKTDSVNEIAKDITLTKTRIRKDFTVKKTTVANLEGRTFSLGIPVGLMHYQARQTQKGVTVKVKRDSPRMLIPGAFIATAKRATNVFWREWHGPKRKVRTAWRSGGRSGGLYQAGFPYSAMPEKYRLPIHMLTGPRVPDIMGKPEVMKDILSLADVRIDKNLANQLDFELSKL